MKKAKAPKVPVLEQAFELNLPKLMRSAKAAGSARLVLNDGEVRTVVMLSETRLAAFLGGRAWVTDISSVKCLGGRLRPLLKCPRAHEGNFQSLYYWAGEVACRHCHRLRYRSNLVACAADRAHLARLKLQMRLGSNPASIAPARAPGKWRIRHQREIAKLTATTAIHYSLLRRRLLKGA